jgi:hypothetical protein
MTSITQSQWFDLLFAEDVAVVQTSRNGKLTYRETITHDGVVVARMVVNDDGTKYSGK